MSEHVILVDEKDNQIGTAEKLDAHKKGVLHRAFSIIVFNSNGEMMLQQRAKTKYHSGGLWTNTCCGHPRPNEDLLTAAHRRLKEENGFDCELAKLFEYTYQVKLDKRLTENEFLHVFKGVFDGVPKLNPEEAADWKWISMEDLRKDIELHPENYTQWFKLTLDKWK